MFWIYSMSNPRGSQRATITVNRCSKKHPHIKMGLKNTKLCNVIAYTSPLYLLFCFSHLQGGRTASLNGLPPNPPNPSGSLPATLSKGKIGCRERHLSSKKRHICRDLSSGASLGYQSWFFSTSQHFPANLP